MAIKIQYYKGIKFIRYENQNYYCTTTDSHMLLHRFIWLCEKGEIPEGYDVHHIDHDFDHNEISNFELLTRSEHIKKHFEEMPEEKKEVIRNNMRKARFSQKCIDYHTSDEAKKERSKYVKKAWEDGKMKQPTEYICEVCGKSYVRYPRAAKHRFCSWKCETLFNNPEKELICPICGKKFIKPAGKIGITCSKSCSVKLNHKNRRERKGN